jgi:hypothetical protein
MKESVAGSWEQAFAVLEKHWNYRVKVPSDHLLGIKMVYVSFVL